MRVYSSESNGVRFYDFFNEFIKKLAKFFYVNDFSGTKRGKHPQRFDPIFKDCVIGFGSVGHYVSFQGQVEVFCVGIDCGVGGSERRNIFTFCE